MFHQKKRKKKESNKIIELIQFPNCKDVLEDFSYKDIYTQKEFKIRKKITKEILEQAKNENPQNNTERITYIFTAHVILYNNGAEKTLDFLVNKTLIQPKNERNYSTNQLPYLRNMDIPSNKNKKTIVQKVDI